MEDFFAEHFFGYADADLGYVVRFPSLLDVMSQVLPQVEQTLPMRKSDALEIRLAIGEMCATRVEQSKLGREAPVISGDDEVEA